MTPHHAPTDYQCYFCAISAGRDGSLTKQAEVVLRTDDMTAFISSHWWPENAGHVLIIPNQHIENVYEFPAELGRPLMDVTRQVAIALKAVYGCHGVSTRQHNEPAGNQDVWHFHQHVFPRWTDDRLYARHAEKRLAPQSDRIERAASLRSHFTQ